MDKLLLIAGSNIHPIWGRYSAAFGLELDSCGCTHMAVVKLKQEFAAKHTKAKTELPKKENLMYSYDQSLKNANLERNTEAAKRYTSYCLKLDKEVKKLEADVSFYHYCYDMSIKWLEASNERTTDLERANEAIQNAKWEDLVQGDLFA